MSGHLFRSQTSAFFHAVCGRMDSGTFSKSLVRFLERRVKLVRRHGSMLIIIAALAIVIGLFYGGGSSGLPGNGKFSGGCTGNISECDR